MACHYAVRKGAQKRDEQDDPTDIEGELAELAAFFYIDAASKIETDHPWEIFYMCGTSTCTCGTRSGSQQRRLGDREQIRQADAGL